LLSLVTSRRVGWPPNANTGPLLDDLIRPRQHRRRDRQAEGLARPQIDAEQFRGAQARTPSTTLHCEGVDRIRVNANPADSNNARNSAAVRSRPPCITSMFRSSNLPGCGSFPDGITFSSSKSFAP